MATRQEIIDMIEERLTISKQVDIEWEDVLAGIESADTATKAALLAAFKSNSGSSFLSTITALVDTSIATDAKDEAETMMKNNQLSLKEMQIIF